MYHCKANNKDLETLYLGIVRDSSSSERKDDKCKESSFPCLKKDEFSSNGLDWFIISNGY